MNHAKPSFMPRKSLLTAAALAVVVGCSSTARPVTSNDDGADGAAEAGETTTEAGAPAACTSPPDCLQRFAPPGSTHALPIYATHPIDQPNPAITRIVIFNQGLDRDADTDFSTMVTAATSANALVDTLIVTPHFEAVVETDGAACSGHADDPAPSDLIWTCDAWSDGLASTNDANATSYGVLDALIAALEQTFPQVERITVSGFSAGGQLTQRYAAANRVDRDTAPPFRYVVGSPSSYLYFDTQRPVNAGNCTATGCPDGFAVYPGAATCADYNDWKYGTDALEGAAAALTPDALTAAYVARDIHYLLGALDDAATAAADDSQLDVTCAAEAEGDFRLQRGLAFYAYAATVLDVAQEQLQIVAGCGHSPSCVFESDAGVSAVFGD